MVKKKVDDEEEMLFEFRAHRDNNGGEGDVGNGNGNGRRQCKSRGMEKTITIFRQIFPHCNTSTSWLKCPTGGL